MSFFGLFSVRVSVSSASVSIVGHQREVFLISLGGISFDAEVLSIQLATHMRDAINTKFRVELVQVDHHARSIMNVNKESDLPTATDPHRRLFGVSSQNGHRKLDQLWTIEGGSYVLFRCPSSLYPKIAPTNHLRKMEISCTLTSYRETVASCPQLAHYTIRLKNVNVSVPPLELKLDTNSLLTDIEDLIGSMWISNPVPG